MLHKIRCNPMNPLYGVLPVLYVPVRDTRGTLVAHRYTYAPLSCRSSYYRMTFIIISMSLSNDLADPAFDSVGLSGFKSMANAISLALLFGRVLFPLFLLSLFSFYGLVVSAEARPSIVNGLGVRLLTSHMESVSSCCASLIIRLQKKYLWIIFA